MQSIRTEKGNMVVKYSTEWGTSEVMTDVDLNLKVKPRTSQKCKKIQFWNKTSLFWNNPQITVHLNVSSITECGV